MPKRIEDIIPGTKRSIRDVPIKEKKEPEIKKDFREKMQLPIAPPREKRPSRKQTGKRSVKILLIILTTIIIVAIAGYFVSSYFARAIFSVKMREVSVVAGNNAILATPSAINGSLTYQIASIKTAASTTISATIGAHTESKAQGTVTFYNTYSSSAWKLIAGTRIKNNEGLIYRLNSTILIPGYKTVNGTLTPGSITGTVTADATGEKYNMTRSDEPETLHIVAYAGNSKDSSVYAKVTSSIRGGFIGNKVSVSSSVLASTTSRLQTVITNTAWERIKSSIPKDYIFYENAYTTSFEKPIVSQAPNNKATITLEGTVYGILFKKTDLAAKLAGLSVVQTFKNMAYDTPGIEKLSFSISNPKDFSPIKKNTLIFQLKGSMKLVGILPTDELKTKIAGLSLAETEQIMRNYSPIIDLEKSSGQVVPPWAHIPKDPEKISIVIEE